MTETAEIATMAETLRLRLEQVYGLKGRSLQGALRRSRGLLPRGLRRQGLALAEAAEMMGNPRLARVVDIAEARAAYAALSEHLDGVDVVDLWRGWLLGVLGPIALNLLIIAVAFVAWLAWRGYV